MKESSLISPSFDAFYILLSIINYFFEKFNVGVAVCVCLSESRTLNDVYFFLCCHCVVCLTT